ncbi:MAG: pyruvate kinase [Bacteroidales bacterium]|nr:pyruvate kinase [Bacteroidales bacterium]MCF8328319.1 pyruvate kinase [Bacteroidales bacterium]
MKDLKTKIITTIGPASSDYKTLEEFMKEGVDVFRINFSHGNHAEHRKTIETIHELNLKHHCHAAILADLQGPKIRIGNLKYESLDLKEGDILHLQSGKLEQTDENVPVDYPGFSRDVMKGEQIQIDDGRIVLEAVGEIDKDTVKAKVLYGGKLLSRKGINLPNTRISLPALTEKDMKDLEFILTQKVQWIALSFVRSAADIIELRHHISSKIREKSPLIVAKIEKPEALEDIDNIIDKADALMIARGDLGIEIPLEEVPLIQKDIVRKCMTRSKPTIIATQMMEGMISNFSPTRAEVNDVANSVLDGSDALMLSGETSIGHNPVKVVKVMKRIIAYVESHQDIYYKHFSPETLNNERFISDSIVYNACEMAEQVKASVIVGMTHSGYSAFEIAGQRPKARIFIFTNNHSILSKLSLVWGIQGFYYDKFISTDHTIEDILMLLQRNKLVNKGDFVINIASTPLDQYGQTNMMKLSVV